MENLQKLGKVLGQEKQKSINGGKKGLFVCVAPYLTPDFTCQPGYHLHPQGHCICCRD